MQKIPDYTNLKMTMDGIKEFFKDSNVKISKEDSAKINTIFQECDTKNAKGEKKPDGELTGQERIDFLDKIKSELYKFYQIMIDLFTVIEVKEELEEDKKRCLQQFQEADKEQERIKMNEKIENSFTSYDAD